VGSAGIYIGNILSISW